MSVVMCWPPTATASTWTNWPSVKTADGRRAAAEVDAGAAELGLVVDERRQAAGIGRGDDGLDREMAAVDAELEIAERRRVGGDDVHVDAEALADHAARIGDAAIGRRGE